MIRKVVEEVFGQYPLVICINDGSTDNSSEEISKTPAILLEHAINLGQGAALQTGIDYALELQDVLYFVTFDADGQHSIKDIKTLITTLKESQVDVVLGSRFLGNTINMPPMKKVLLKAAILFTNFFSGVKLTDTHNGLRAFTRKFAKQLNITMPRMSHASEIIDKIGRGKWRYKEVPVTISYSEYSRAKGQSILNSVNITFDMLLSRILKR